MDSSHILSLIDQLDDEIDDIEEALEPLTNKSLVDIASKLPLLDKSKLYVLTTYAIESIIFSYLRLHGVKAREHPVFRELTRVKQYFDKIKAAEHPEVMKPNTALDKGAAKRFISAGLSGNDAYDLAREKAKKEIQAQKRKVMEAHQVTTAKQDSSDISSSESSVSQDSVPAPKKQKFTPPTEASAPNAAKSASALKNKKKQDKKRAKKSAAS